MGNRFKHIPVTDMTFGQLYDAVANGEEFYFHDQSGGAKLVINENGTLYANCGFLGEKQSEIILALTCKRITHLVPWTDKLDGTWENGVWCSCKTRDHYVVTKIVRFTEDDDYSCEGFKDSDHNIYNNAEPLSEGFAYQLEALSKGGN